MKSLLFLCLAFTIQLFVNNEIHAQCTLTAPKNLKFVQTGNTTGSATWDKVANANGYQVKLYKVTATGNQLIDNKTSDIPQIALTVPTPGAKYMVVVAAICPVNTGGGISPNSSKAERQFIIEDTICILKSPCLQGEILDNKYTLPSPAPFTPLLQHNITWVVGDVVKITATSGLSMRVWFRLSNTANVCGGTKISSGVYTLGAGSSAVTVTLTPNSSELKIVINKALQKVDKITCYTPSSKQANTSNNPTTLETTDKSELQEAEEETNEIQAENLQIAPNPFENYLRLNFENATIKQISLVNQLGQIVKSPAPQQEKNGILDIDTSDLRAGYYYCIVKTESKDYLFKVVKIE